MKNTIKQTSIFKYIAALAFTLVLSMFISLAFSIGEGSVSNALQYVPQAFITILALQLLVAGFANKYFAGASLRDDSLVVQDTTYAGTFAPYFILPALFGMDTYDKGVVYFKDGIKKKHTIGKLDFTNPLQPRVATPTQSGGDIVITGNVLNPQDIMLYQEFNPRDLEAHWVSEDLSETLLTRQLPPSIENYITMLVVGRAFEQFELGIWQGSVQYQNNGNVPSSDPRFQLQFFDGFLKRFVNDSSIYQTASPVTLTAANIFAAMQDLYQGMATNNKAMLAKPNKYTRLKFLVSVNTDLIYENFLTTQPFKNNDTTEKGIRRFKGFEIVPLAGLPDNTIVFTEADADVEGNLWLGMNSILDENFQLARKFANSEMFFLKMLMKMDVNYGFANKIFLYTTLTTGSFIA